MKSNQPMPDRIEPTHFIEVWKLSTGRLTESRGTIDDLKYNLIATSQTGGCETIAIFKIKAK
jgi:hypothetical protein